MPKRTAATYESDDGFVEADASTSTSNNKPSPKKTKISPTKKARTIKSAAHISDSEGDSRIKSGFASSKGTLSKGTGLAAARPPQHDENGDKFWTINEPGTRRVTLNKFKGKWMVNVREYYDAGAGGGGMKPGKKGISLPLEQYNNLLSIVPQLEKALAEEGEGVMRPDFGGVGDADGGEESNEEMEVEDEKEEEEEEDEEPLDGKANHEATSEED